MATLYENREQLHRGSRSHVLRARHAHTGEAVVLKQSAADGSSALAQARSEREYSIAASVHSEYVARYLGLEHDRDGVAVVVEAFGDASLAQLLARSPLPLETALRICLQVALGLADIHTHDVIHCAIHPGNVLVETSSWRAKIIDFSAASVLEEAPAPAAWDAHGIPPAYISPEQTGRTNRSLDYRSDFYSLGATLYHALAGRPPFESVDTLAVVHAHIAASHKPLSALNPQVPPVVSELVDKLLAKNAEDRYQSARGIAADLEACLKRLGTSGYIAEFPLGRHDVPEKLVVPRRLYGRNRERAMLLEAFDAAAAGGKLMLLITGPSGVGKSAFVNEVHKPLLEKRGIFVSGKFDPLHGHAPYSALAQALNQLCQRVLSVPEAELAQWKARILERVSLNAGVIADLAPNLVRIVGPPPPVPAVGLMEAQHRFDLTLARFVSAFAYAEHPLVVFLDDLQRADPATLHALSALLRLPEPMHLLIIAAYRDHEVVPPHPLSAMLDELHAASVDVRRVELAGLSHEDALDLLQDTLHRPRNELSGLAAQIVERTGGNPFFIHQALRTLRDSKHLRFDPSRGMWTWDSRALETLGIADNVVELMLRKMERLPPATFDNLRLAACIGTEFDLQLLSATANVCPACMRAQLAPAIRDGLVVPLDPDYPLGLVDVSSDQACAPGENYRYRFLHDRVQQAAYESIPEETRPALHLKLGRILQAREQPARLFETVDQLNRGGHLLTERWELTELCRLNLEAGKRARASTAYGEALEYLRRGCSYLPSNAWTELPELSRDLHLAHVECAYLSRNFEEADALAERLLPKLGTAVEKAQLYQLRIVLETHRNQHARAVELAREALAGLGHPLPRTPSAAQLLKARARVALAMSGRRVDELEKLPELSNPELSAVVDILNRLHTPAFMVDPRLFYWVVHKSLLLALEHGVTASTLVSYSTYGVLLLSGSGDYAGAVAYGRLGLSLAERTGAFAYRALVFCIFAVCHSIYADDFRATVSLLERTIDMGLESGDLVTASLALAALPDAMFLTGAPLPEVMHRAERCERSLRSFRSAQMLLWMRMVKQFLRCVRGETDGRTSFTTQDHSESALEAELEAATAQVVRSSYLIRKVLVQVLFGEHERAVRTIVAYEGEIERLSGAGFVLTEYHFFSCLALASALRAPKADRRQLLRLLRKKRRLLSRWSELAPMNFRHKHLLVCAEYADLEGQPSRATDLYDEAVREAEARDYTQHAALAAERAGQAAQRRGNEHLARMYLVEARAGYERWGALGKVRALDEAYPGLVPKPSAMKRAPPALDLVSIVRTSQALSREISLPALLERIMRVIVQTSGARRGYLLHVPEPGQDGDLRIEARLDAEQNAVLVPSDAWTVGNGFVSEAIVRYTLRTGDDVVLANASEEGPFTRDPYVVSHASKSILSMAVRTRDRVIGVLFLENELAIGAFSEERLEVLRLLLAQAAISLQNARLVDSLRSQEALLRGYLEGMPLGVYVTDASGRLVFANRKATEIGGRGADLGTPLEAVRALYRLYVTGTDQPYPLERAPLTRALLGESSMVDDMEIRLAGRSVPLAVWATPIRGPDGAVRHAIVAFQDVSAERAMESERARLEAQLHQAERLESIGRLAGGVAHDFNNLLTPMLAYSEMAMDQVPEDSPVRHQIAQVREAAERAAALTRQLLAFGRKQAIEPRIVDLNQEVESFVPLFRRLSREDVEISLQLPTTLRKVRADPAQLQRILLNLGTNAVDAMPRGGRLVFETENVFCDPGTAVYGPHGDCVALRITDTGHGMDKDTMAKIFDPFFTTKMAEKGTGLGLPTVYGLVEQHGGHLSVRSEPGQGSTFEILLPSAPEDAAQPPRPTRPEKSLAARGHGQTILVVEDDAAVRAVIQEVFTRAGYRVFATGNPEEAIAMAQGLEGALDLLVTDVVMPIMNGRELLRALSQKHPNLPVLFVSGYSEEVLGSGDTDGLRAALLPKPLTPEALQAKVHEMLEAHRA